jgi:hypothetical protein
VPVPAAWQAHARPDKRFPNRSFEKSLDFVLELTFSTLRTDPIHTGLWLVHGFDRGGRPHGWVELPGGVVFDGVNQRFYAREDYYREAGARPTYRYGPEAVVFVYDQIPEVGGTGRIPVGNWHLYLDLPAAPGAPRVMTRPEIRARALRAGWGGPTAWEHALYFARIACTRPAGLGSYLMPELASALSRAARAVWPTRGPLSRAGSPRGR